MGAKRPKASAISGRFLPSAVRVPSDRFHLLEAVEIDFQFGIENGVVRLAGAATRCARSAVSAAR